MTLVAWTSRSAHLPVLLYGFFCSARTRGPRYGEPLPLSVVDIRLFALFPTGRAQRAHLQENRRPWPFDPAHDKTIRPVAALVERGGCWPPIRRAQRAHLQQNRPSRFYFRVPQPQMLPYGQGHGQT